VWGTGEEDSLGVDVDGAGPEFLGSDAGEVDGRLTVHA
jgi:hypothetical protein